MAVVGCIVIAIGAVLPAGPVPAAGLRRAGYRVRRGAAPVVVRRRRHVRRHARRHAASSGSSAATASVGATAASGGESGAESQTQSPGWPRWARSARSAARSALACEPRHRSRTRLPTSARDVLGRRGRRLTRATHDPHRRALSRTGGYRSAGGGDGDGGDPAEQTAATPRTQPPHRSRRCRPRQCRGPPTAAGAGGARRRLAPGGAEAAPAVAL